MSLVFGGAKSDDFQFVEDDEIYVPEGSYAVYDTRLSAPGSRLSEVLGLVPAGALSADWLSQNQITGTDALGTTAGFTASGATITSSDEQAHGGTKSLKVVTAGSATGEGYGLVTSGQSFVVNQAAVGQKWYTAVWIYAPVGATLQLRILERNAAGGYLALGLSSFVGTGAWQAVTLAYTLTQATVAQIDVWVETSVAAQAITLYTDDIELYRTDMTGNAHAAITGAVWATGPNGPVLRFDGVDDYAKVMGDLIGVGAISVEALVYVNGWGEGGYGGIFNNGQFRLYVDNVNSNVRFERQETFAASSAAITLGKWYHILVTSTAAGALNIYINGVLSGTANQDGGTPAAGSDTWIGTRIGVVGTWDGDIALVRLYNKILTAGEAREAFYEVGALVGLG